MKSMKRISVMLLIVVLALSVFSACGQESPSTGDERDLSEDTREETLELTWWHPLISPNINSSNDDILAYQKIQENTNVDIEWIHPTPGSDLEQFNIMLASRDYPDIITHNWGRTQGGVTRALSSGVILQLNDLIDQYAPNYYNLVKDNRASMLDDGIRVGFHPPVFDARQSAFRGLQIRKDWLDTLNLKIPETIDDWYQVLTAFKNNDLNNTGELDIIPLGDDGGFQLKDLAVAWGVVSNFYIHPDSDKIEYGPIQPEYKEFLSTLAKWYAEGLIDEEFAAIDGNVYQGKISGNQTGAYVHMLSRLQVIPPVGKEHDPNFELVAAPWPIGPGGKEYSGHPFNEVTAQTISISTNNKYPEETTKFLDYFYSEEGIDLINWGVEGETYTIVDGQRKYTDLILNNPDYPPTSAIMMYAHPTLGFNAPLDYEAQMQVQTPVQIEAGRIWGGADFSLLLPVMSLTAEESAKMSTIMSEIDAYKDEMIMKFIMGLEPLEKFDDYVSQIERMGIDDITKIQRDAYSRFQAR